MIECSILIIIDHNDDYHHHHHHNDDSHWFAVRPHTWFEPHPPPFWAATNISQSFLHEPMMVMRMIINSHTAREGTLGQNQCPDILVPAQKKRFDVGIQELVS